MDGTTFETHGRTRSENIKSGVESNGERRAIPASDNGQLLAIFSLGCSYFEAHGLNHMDAQDLAIEVSLRWLSQVHAGKPASLAWLRTVQSHLLIDQLRCKEREHRLLESFADSLQDPESAPTAGDGAWEETLGRLPALDREILRAHYGEGFSVRELAARLECSIDCVKQRLLRARARLHSVLAESGRERRF